jgi:short-subunit dehydrogenase
MPNSKSRNPSAERKAYIITGPTSGIGRRTALDVAKHGTAVLVGRDREKLGALQKEIVQKGGNAVFADFGSFGFANALTQDCRFANYLAHCCSDYLAHHRS